MFTMSYKCNKPNLHHLMAKTVLCVHEMEYYLVIKRNEELMHATT